MRSYNSIKVSHTHTHTKRGKKRQTQYCVWRWFTASVIIRISLRPWLQTYLIVSLRHTHKHTHTYTHIHSYCLMKNVFPLWLQSSPVPTQPPPFPLPPPLPPLHPSPSALTLDIFRSEQQPVAMVTIINTSVMVTWPAHAQAVERTHTHMRTRGERTWIHVRGQRVDMKERERENLTLICIIVLCYFSGMAAVWSWCEWDNALELVGGEYIRRTPVIILLMNLTASL